MQSSKAGMWGGPLILAAGSMLDQSPDVFIDAAARAGFDGVGLRVSGEHAINDVAGFSEEVRRRGMTIHDSEVHRIAESPVDPELLLAATAAMGVKRLLIVSDLADRSATMSALVDLVNRCEAYDIRVGLEYMAWTNPSNPLDAIEIAGATGCELVVDLLHHHRVGAGANELQSIVDSGSLGWVQLCDAPFRAPGSGNHSELLREARHDRLPPGHGQLPLASHLRLLPNDVAISVEVQSDDLLLLPPIERAALLHDAARRVLAS